MDASTTLACESRAHEIVPLRPVLYPRLWQQEREVLRPRTGRGGTQTV